MAVSASKPLFRHIMIMNTTTGIPSRMYGVVESPPKSLHFPPEITYVILEHLGMATKDTIKALCLTARDFWDPCQRALFTTVDIITTWSSISSQNTESRLLTALKTTPRLATFTRHLTCHCSGNETEDYLEKIREHTLFQLLPLFKELRTISLEFPGTVQTLPDIQVQCKIHPNVFAHLLKPILQQRSLVRASLKFVPADVLWYCSPSIMHMSLGRIFPPLLCYPYESKRNEPMKLQVESLYLDSGHSLHWLVCVSTHNFAHLRKLSINMPDCLHNCSYHRTSRFLEHCSRFPKLEVLSLHVSPCRHGKQIRIFIA